MKQLKQYIDKDAVVAELERLYNLEYNNASNLSCGKKIMLRNILLFLDTLETKEMSDSNDLEEEIENELKRTWCGEYLNTDKFKESAVYFFELGLKTQKEE